MMKKLLPLAALSASTHAGMIPIELEQNREEVLCLFYFKKLLLR